MAERGTARDSKALLASSGLIREAKECTKQTVNADAPVFFPAVLMCHTVLLSTFGAEPWNYYFEFDAFYSFHNYPYLQPKFVLNFSFVGLHFRTQAGFGHCCNKNKNITNTILGLMA